MLNIFRTGLTFSQLLPEDRTQYDKMRPPKKDGAPTIVYFHVTVMGLDSIDETSMVCNFHIVQCAMCIRRDRQKRVNVFFAHSANYKNVNGKTIKSAFKHI